MEAVIMQYSVIMGTLEDVHLNTWDEYALKAGGLLASLAKFETFFSLKLGCLLFGCSDNTPKYFRLKTSQYKRLSMQFFVHNHFINARGV